MNPDLAETALMPVTVTVTAGPDGVLTLRIPLGPAWANRDVRVTIEEVSASAGAAVQ
jgi:hypothetical protein